jgi:hypothetical protein
MSDSDNLTISWTCHICREERPDASISAITHHRTINGVPFEENVRFCNDRQGCIEGAKAFRFIKAEGVEDA